MFDFVRKHTRIMQFLLFLLIVPSFLLFGIEGYSRFRDKGETEDRFLPKQGLFDRKSPVRSLRAAVRKLGTVVRRLGTAVWGLGTTVRRGETIVRKSRTVVPRLPLAGWIPQLSVP